MGAPRSSASAPEWLPSGFPPRSFQPGASAPPPPRAPRGGRRGGRGWWFAAAAAFLAVLLLAGALLAATRGDGGSDLAASTSTSTSGLETSLPTFEATTTPLPVLPSIDPVTTLPSDSTTTGAPAAPGVLEPSLSTLAMPKADASAGASQAPLTLRNRGATALTYTTQSSATGLSAAPARGTIGPGASTAITVTLDAAQIKTEGAFSGTLSFGGTGGTSSVLVVSTVGRPPEIRDDVGESCAAPSGACSRQIKLGPSTSPAPTPCNTAWLYSVTITDQSRIQNARAIARRGGVNADVPLQRYGTTDIFLSDPIPPLQSGTLRFAIEAVDEHGFGRRLAEQAIAC